MSRGMKKFLPFASLKEQAIFLAQMQYEKQKIEKPIISEDTQMQINEVLCQYSGETVCAYYYDKGFIKSLTGKIKKIDTYTATLVFEEKRILFTNLLNIEIVD